MLKLSSKVASTPSSSRINAPPPKMAAAVRPTVSAAVDRFEAAKVPSAATIAADVRAAREAAAALRTQPGAAAASPASNPTTPGLFVGPGHSSPVKWMPGMGAGSGGLENGLGTLGGNQRRPQGPMDPSSVGPTASPFDRRGLVMNNTDNVTHMYENLQRNNGWNAQPSREKDKNLAPDAPSAQRGAPTPLERYKGPGARMENAPASGPANRLPDVNPLGPDPEFQRSTGAPIDLTRNRIAGPGANPGRDPLIG